MGPDEKSLPLEQVRIRYTTTESLEPELAKLRVPLPGLGTQLPKSQTAPGEQKTALKRHLNFNKEQIRSNGRI